MSTGLRTPSGYSGKGSAVAAAVAALRAGKLAIIPTETVYGVAARAAVPEAVAVLRAAEAAADQPSAASTWHAASAPEVIRTLRITHPLHLRLFQRLAPGPIRFLVQKESAEIITILAELGLPAGLIERNGEFSIRISEHPLARAVLEKIEGVVIADRTSAFGLGDGRTLPDDIDERAGAIGIAAILNDGPTRLGKPSTAIHLASDGTFEVVPGGVYDERYIKKKIEQTILYVCTGNTCRSPMAEAIARDALAKSKPVIPTRVVSAGVTAVNGEPMTREAQDALTEMKVDPGRHRSKELTPLQVSEAEVIYAMTKGHMQAVLEMAPSAADKVVLLDPEGFDVPDPIGKSEKEYRSTARRLKMLVDGRLAELRKAAQLGGAGPAASKSATTK